MPRIVGAVLLGYLVLFALLFPGLLAGYLTLGPERVFRAGVYDVTVSGMVLGGAIVFGAAYAAGHVAHRVSRGERAPAILALVVLLLGLGLAIQALFAYEGGAAAPRPGDVAPIEALLSARVPMWLLLLSPFIAAVGIIVGGQDMDAVEGAAPAAPARR